MNDKAVITCALTGVLTDPEAASRAGHARKRWRARQERRSTPAPPSCTCISASRRPARAICRRGTRASRCTIMQAIRDACPGVILNETTGTLGPDISGPLACLRAVKPEIAACNAGSLNYLKVRADGSWAWPPHLFDNPVEKVQSLSRRDARDRARSRNSNASTSASCAASACTRKNGMFAGRPKYNFVMGVESGMPADPDLLPDPAEAHRRPARRGRSPPSAARRSGRCTGAPPSSAAICAPALRTRSICPTAASRLERRAGGHLVRYAREAGRAIASPAEARALMGPAAAP